jgi:hypothetical protein
MLYRGCPDPLTTSITNLWICAKRNRTTRRIYVWLQAGLYGLGKGDPELLISNPKAPHPEVPLTVSSKMKKDLRVLIKSAKNIHIEHIFTVNKINEDQELFKYLKPDHWHLEFSMRSSGTLRLVVDDHFTQNFTILELYKASS